MKDLIFIKYPQITSLKANIINRRYEDNKTKIVLDKTIFTPDNDTLIKDQGEISSLKVLDVYEKNGKIVHVVEGKPHKSDVLLQIDKNIRFHNLAYNTAYIILEMVLRNFYNIKHCKLKLHKSYSQMVISDFFVDFDKEQTEEFINYLINLGLDIENTKDTKKINSIGEVLNPNICYSNTSEIYGIHIFRYNIIGNGLILEFITGKDYINFNKNNLELIKKIEKLATSEDISSNKITKIISSIKNNKY